MFFGEALGLSASNLMATHPPLADRIQRIDPTFDGDFSTVELAPARRERLEASASLDMGPATRPRPRSMRFDPVRAITSIGTLGPENLAYASTLLASLPDPVTDAARDPSRRLRPGLCPAARPGRRVRPRRPARPPGGTRVRRDGP